MNVKTDRLSILLVFSIVSLFSKIGMSVICGERGNRPIEDRGWPIGSVQVANLPGRLGYWEGPPFGGGEYCFLYCCRNTNEFNQALKTFSVIRADGLELIVHNGPEYSFWLRENDEELSKEENRVDWTFTVWVPDNWNRLFNSPHSYMLSSDQPNFKKPVAAPRTDLYIGGGGSIVWEDVNVPKNVAVIDKRHGSISPKFAGMGLIRGKVFDMATGRPLAGAEITLANHQSEEGWKELMHGETDNQGFCQIANIPLGYYEIRVKAEGYVPRKQGGYNNQRPEYHQFKIGLAHPSYIKGIVTGVDGKPIEGAKVSAINIIGGDGYGYSCVDDRAAVTDKQGRFGISSLPEGLTNIRCYAESLHLKNLISKQYPIPSDEIKLTMTGTGIVQGKVIDKDGEKLSSRVHVHIRSLGEQIGKWGGSHKCKEDGSFEFIGVPPGEYLIGTDIKLVTEGDKTNARLILVEAGKTYEVEVVHIEQ